MAVHLLRVECLMQKSLEEVVSLAEGPDLSGAGALVSLNKICKFLLRHLDSKILREGIEFAIALLVDDAEHGLSIGISSLSKRKPEPPCSGIIASIVSGRSILI